MAEHPNAPRCHHVRTNGLRCGSPAMRNFKLCYFHKKTSGPVPMPKACLPNLEDGNALQLAIGHVVRQIVQGTIEYRAAHLLIDAYRLALRNLKNMDHRVVQPGKQVTVDEDMDDLHNNHTAEPLTHDEEKELMEEGTLPTREAVASQPNHVPPAEQGEQSEAAVNHGFNEKLETRNEKLFEDMSEQEQEAYIMRATGNKAYFMKEDQMPKRPPESDDNLSLRELLKEAFVG